MGRTVQRMAAFYREHVCADPLDRCTHRHEEPGEILDVGLAGGITKNRDPLGSNGSREGVFGAGDARLVEEDVGPSKLLGRENVCFAKLEMGPKLLKREEVRIEAP